MALRHAIIALLRVWQKNQAGLIDTDIGVNIFCVYKECFCADLPDRYSGH